MPNCYQAAFLALSFRGNKPLQPTLQPAICTICSTVKSCGLLSDAIIATVDVHAPFFAASDK